jgi:hypothetical protein
MNHLRKLGLASFLFLGPEEIFRGVIRACRPASEIRDAVGDNV